MGVQHASITSNDGTAFIGNFDGRATVPFSATTDPSTITFADGSALPVVTSTTPGLIDQITSLLQTASTFSPTNCIASQTPIQAVRPFEPFPGCDDCKLKCGGELYTCYANVLWQSPICGIVPIVGNIVCAAITWAECTEAYGQNCNDACEAPGHPCCPVACSGNRCCGTFGDICCGDPSYANST